MLIETGAVIAFVQMTFWLVIHNDPEPHSAAAADAAGKRIFGSADSDTPIICTWECMHGFEFRLEKEKKEKKSG